MTEDLVQELIDSLVIRCEIDFWLFYENIKLSALRLVRK